MLKDTINASLNRNKTRPYESQPMPVSYSKIRYSHSARGVTAMQGAFMEAMLK